MRVLVFGGRDYSDSDAVWAALDRVLAKHGPFTLVEGGARGADRHAGRWAEARAGVRHEVYPADWSKLGRRAGVVRNQEMLDSGLDAAVGFPGGRGTADMARRLERAGVPVWWPVTSPGRSPR